MFTRAIVKSPCRNMIRGITSSGMGQPDYETALEQHRRYIRLLESCGLAVTVLPPDENFPDSTFIEDACLITPECAVLTRPGALSRREEPNHILDIISNTGLPVESITAPGTLDAGDIMMVGSHYYIGLSDRTSKTGADMLIDILDKYGLTGSTVELTSVLHLKTGISYLEQETFLACGEFLEKPDFKRFILLPVPPEEAYAANSVRINDWVIVPDGFEITAGMIQNAGFGVKTVDVSEFRKLDGGLSCLSLRF